MFFDKESKIREWIGGVTALWLCFYVIASLIIKHQAKIYFEEQLLVNGINPTRTMTAPTISNIFLWRMVAETNEHYHIGYWSLFDDSDRPLKLETLAKGHDYLEKFDQFQETNTLKWFANNWHMIVPENKNSNTVLFIDLRFTEMVTADKKYPIFVWRLKTDANDLQHLDFSPVSYRDQAPPKETVQYLWQRIIGSAPHWMDATWPWQSQPLKQ
jgi:inner membrane protein